MHASLILVYPILFVFIRWANGKTELAGFWLTGWAWIHLTCFAQALQEGAESRLEGAVHYLYVVLFIEDKLAKIYSFSLLFSCFKLSSKLISLQELSLQKRVPIEREFDKDSERASRICSKYEGTFWSASPVECSRLKMLSALRLYRFQVRYFIIRDILGSRLETP